VSEKENQNVRGESRRDLEMERGLERGMEKVAEWTSSPVEGEIFEEEGVVKREEGKPRLYLCTLRDVNRISTCGEGA